MTDYELLLKKVRELGMDYKWAKMFVKKLKDDEAAFNVEDDKKKWALEHGFYPGRIELYGLNEKNYFDYIPDYQYFMLHPLNNHFLKWLDKTTLKYILNSSGCEDSIPEYYVYVENNTCGGKYTYLMDCPDDINKDKNFLWNLLNRKKILALKPNSGTSGGLGFIKLELKDNYIYENNKIIDVNRFEEIRDSIRNYIITEYVKQHHDLDDIWNQSECTLRVIMCKNYDKDIYAVPAWSCVVSYARFGTSVNGGASNLSSGGVGVGFDFESGKFNDYCIRYKRYTENGIWKLTEHPDTHILWKNKNLPNWNIVKSKIYQVCNHISSLDYLGLDIIITETGMKICEINSHPALDYEQVMCGPVLRNKKVNEFFNKKGLKKFDSKKFYTAYTECQK